MDINTGQCSQIGQVDRGMRGGVMKLQVGQRRGSIASPLARTWQIYLYLFNILFRPTSISDVISPKKVWIGYFVLVGIFLAFLTLAVSTTGISDDCDGSIGRGSR